MVSVNKLFKISIPIIFPKIRLKLYILIFQLDIFLFLSNKQEILDMLGPNAVNSTRNKNAEKRNLKYMVFKNFRTLFLIMICFVYVSGATFLKCALASHDQDGECYCSQRLPAYTAPGKERLCNVQCPVFGNQCDCLNCSQPDYRCGCGNRSFTTYNSHQRSICDLLGYMCCGVACLPINIPWRILTWPCQTSLNCFELPCAACDACFVRCGKAEPRYGMILNGCCETEDDQRGLSEFLWKAGAYNRQKRKEQQEQSTVQQPQHITTYLVTVVE